VKKCDKTEVYDHNNNCIPLSECTGFVNLYDQRCEEECHNIMLIKADQLYKECVEICHYFTYEMDNS